MRERLRTPWPDRRAERTLGAASLLVGVVVVGMVAFVAVHAWPTLEHNGFVGWLGSGGSLKTQIAEMQATGPHPPPSAYHLRAWPLLWGTILTTGFSVVLGLAIAIGSSIFIGVFPPARRRAGAIPVIRLLASVPSVVYGLIGILVLVPFVGNHVITSGEKASLANRVLLTGAGLAVTVVIVTLMITPIMIALICEALASVPDAWREGAVALGLNPLRATLSVVVRAARPAIVAAAVLATARALGESIAVSMVSGSVSFTPRPGDGIVFFFEPLRTFASAIINFQEGIGAPALRSSLYAFALVLLVGAFVLSVSGYLIKLPLRRYQVRG
jgi:phosphate transport system permease protein